MKIAPQPNRFTDHPFHKTYKGGCLLFCLFFVFSSALVLAEEYRNKTEGILVLNYIDNRLNLETIDADLDKVLKELSLITGVTIVTNAPVTGLLTICLKDCPLDKAMRKVLRGKNISFIYAASAKVPADRSPLREVRIYLEGGDLHQESQYSHDNAEDEKKKKKKYSQKIPFAHEAQAGSSRPFADVLLGGEINDMQELAEKLEEQSPGVQEQLNQLIDYFKEVRD